jgi:fucose 4-O-acetylase-like acetyltransferase
MFIQKFSRPTKRRADLDMAKGLAILLVVFGHLVARDDPAGVLWYEPLRRAVYAFHMPFFLYLSGMTAALSGALLTPPEHLAALLRARAARLLVPFFGLGLLIVLGKLAAAPFLFVDNPPSGLRAGLAALLWNTADSPALSVWYLFVLFVFSVAAPAFLRGDPAVLPALLALTLLLYALDLPATAYLDHLGRYAVFFALGASAGASGERWTALVDRVWPWCLAGLLVSLTAIARWGTFWPLPLELLPVGALSMPALHGLVRHAPPQCAIILLWLGRYCFTIYLLNTLCIGLAKALLLRVASWNAPHFWAFAAALMAAGSLGPVAIKRLLLRHIPALDRMTD